MFVETLMFHFQNQKKLSLTDLCNDIFVHYGIAVKKQSLDERFNKEACKFLKQMLEKSIKKCFKNDSGLRIFKQFKSVKIKDSTSFELPATMKEQYPGNNGFSSEAAMTIQYEYDLKTNNMSDISLSPKNVNDYTNAYNTIDEVRKGDLLIRDLGYISISLLRKVEKAGAFFVNRIKPKTAIYEKSNGKYLPITPSSILKKIRKSGKQYIEKDLYIGSRKYFPCRVIFILLPEEKAIEKKKRQAKKSIRRGNKGNIDKDVAAWLDMNIFITNTPKEIIPTWEVYNIYKLRWQIELIFKTWKQVCQINQLKQVKPTRIEAIIYSQLLWITVNWNIISIFFCHYFNIGRGLISIYKTFKTMKLLSQRLRLIIKSRSDLNNFIRDLEKLLCSNHFKEKRKNRIFSSEILVAFKG